MKMWEQILKKKTAPQYNSNSLNLKKNQEKANNSPSYRCAAINQGNIVWITFFNFARLYQKHRETCSNIS